MPFGEMTVTLDDVAVLLHLPLDGTPLDHRPDFNSVEAFHMAVDRLGMDQATVIQELKDNRGQYLRISCVEDAYKANMARGAYEHAARCYMLFLLGTTILADKSHHLLPVRWMYLIQDLQQCGQWSWGIAALTYLYTQLTKAVFYSTKHFGGYATLLQVIIYLFF